MFTSTDELLSDGNIADGKMLSQFLDAMENSMRLIGPQLREPVTRMEKRNTGEKTDIIVHTQCVQCLNQCKYFLKSNTLLSMHNEASFSEFMFETRTNVCQWGFAFTLSLKNEIKMHSFFRKQDFLIYCNFAFQVNVC